MSGFGPNRRDVLKRMALLGAAGLVPGMLPVWPARAADLTAGFVYIGPREDWGWNESFAVAAAALQGVPNVRVVQADYLPESTDYGSGKDTPETRAYAEAMERLIADHGAGLIFSTSFDHDPFLLAMAKKYPDVVFRQASALANGANPPNVGSQYALLNQGHYVNGVAAGLCTTTNKLGFVAGLPFGTVLLNVNSFLMGSRQTNPDATVRVVFTGGWEGEARDAAATNALVDAGCDVITCHMDAPRVVIETAEPAASRPAVTPSTRPSSPPRATSPAPNINWTGMFETFIETLQKGGTLPNFVTGGYDKDYVASSPFGAGATPEAIAAAKTAMQAMRNGDAIFVGPLLDNTGKIVVPAGTSYGPYADELQQTDYLIDGVIGSIA